LNNCSRTVKKIFNKLLSYFLQGVIIVVPIVAVALSGKYLYDVLRTNSILDSEWLTLLIVFGGILIIGMLARTILLQPLFILFEELLSNTPVLKFVYSSIKDLMEAFVGEKKRFNKPVLVNLINETQLQRFGFVTDESLERLGSDFKGKVAVYIPMSSSVSGNLYIVPADAVTHLPHVDPAELMKYILAGGVTDLEDVLEKKKEALAKEEAERKLAEEERGKQ
jgi:uncharacterized membrane protein